MAGARGKGAVVYLDFNNDNSFAIAVCFRNIKPSGFERGTLTTEPCLSSTAVFDDTDILRYTSWSATMEFDNNTFDAGNIANIIADTTTGAAVKIPLTVPAYVLWTFKFTKVDWDSITFGDKVTVQVEGINITAPSIGTGVATVA